MLKSLSLLVRRPDLTHDQFVSHWTEVHAPLARAIPQLRRYVQNHLPAGAAGEVDGIAELWFDSAADRDAFRASEAGQRWIADGANFLDGPRCRQFAVEETSVIG